MSNSISDFMGSNNSFGDVTIDAVIAGNNNQINQYLQLPAQTDPLPAALAKLATLPQTYVSERSQLPAYSVMPYQPLSDFVGREQQLAQLAQAMLRPDPTMITPIAFASGMGGIGKSSLALEFAHRYGSYFAGGVFWLYAATNETLQASFDRCWDSLKPDEWRYEVKPETRLQVVRELFNQPMPRLLIFDNCEDPTLFNRYRPNAASGCHVLVTSRRSQWPGTINLIVLDSLPPAESRQLLQQLAAQRNINKYLSDDDADQLADLVGHLPLALQLIGSALKFYFRKPAAEYIAALQNQRLASLQTMVKPTDKQSQNVVNHFWSVRDTVALSYGLLPAELRQPCRRLLLLMAYCAPNVVIPWALLQEASGYARDHLTEYLWELAQAGFCNDPTQPRLHPLIADVALDLDAHNYPHYYVEVEQALTELSDTYVAAWAMNDIEQLLPHLEYAHQRACQRAEYDGRLVYQQGLCFQKQRNYAQAQRAYQAAINIYDQAGEKTSPAGLRIKYTFNLASILAHQGQYSAAEALYREILLLTEQKHGSTHADVLVIKHNLAGILGEQGDYAQTERLIREILAVQEQTLGPNDPQTLATKHSLAWAVGYQARYAEAEQLYREVLIARENLLGNEHQDTLISKFGLAWVLASQARNNEAEQLYRDVLIAREQSLGALHPDTITTKYHLAHTLVEQARLSEAEVLLQQLLLAYTQTLGPQHPSSQATNAWLEQVQSSLE
ncbi:tetratricopeptide repeat protein [Herpetosiphon llansteffanensis]|uniref:tetratricopeptide repeat protein n=1 Tax=Herpetosiphon llansteffanensis TaxID=2094568 RepID=UPI000D7BC0D2|nr:tetratricopeptide repeat protein [Herpetosiphon llansteffanensis]